MSWEYDRSLKRYRHVETGRILSHGQQVRLHQAFIDAQTRLTDSIADRLARKTITLQQAQREFRERIKTVYVDEYVLGIGGRGVMTPTDWGRLGGMIKTQYNYAQLLFQEIARGRHSERMLRHKFNNYLQSAGEAFERGRALSFGYELPTYPRDGTQTCRHNCRCNWSIKETSTKVEATWVKYTGDNCDTCIDNQSRYNPLVFNKPSRVLRVA